MRPSTIFSATLRRLARGDGLFGEDRPFPLDRGGIEIVDRERQGGDAAATCRAILRPSSLSTACVAGAFDGHQHADPAEVGRAGDRAVDIGADGALP